MVKKFTAFLTAAVLVLAFCVPAFAENELNYVTDLAGLLTEDENEVLERKAKELSESYDCGVYIVTLEDFTEYVDTNDIDEATQAIYLSEENDFGIGDEKSGILLLLSMAERDYCLYAYGYGNTAFTDYGKEVLAGGFLDDFGDDNWYSGFEDYIRVCCGMLDSSRSGAPVDVPDEAEQELPPARIYGVLACVLIGFLIAFFVRSVLLNELISVKKGSEAEDFVSGGGLRLIEQYDRFTHTTQTRVYDPPKDKSKGSGGTTINSKGGSSRSGKF